MSEAVGPERPVGVVTGGAQGIGRAVAIRLAAQGYLPIVVDADPDAAKATADQVSGEAAVLDVADDAAVREWAADLIRRHGRVDALVNNAGIWRYAPLAGVEPDVARRVVDVNVLGPWWLVQALAPAMRPGSAIVNLSSTAAHIAPAGVGLYPTSKGAVEGMTRHLAVELGPRGIRVNAVAPGLIRTAATEHGYADGTRQALGAQLPAGRHGEPSDVANVIAFLVGPDSAYVTGQVIAVDGGLTLVGVPPKAIVATTAAAT